MQAQQPEQKPLQKRSTFEPLTWKELIINILDIVGDNDNLDDPVDILTNEGLQQVYLSDIGLKPEANELIVDITTK